MFLKRTVSLLLLIFLLTITAEGELIQGLRQRRQIGLERYQVGNDLKGQKCEPMPFSFPKPETGCCGLHSFDETNFRAGKRIYKRNVQDEEMYDGETSDEDDDLDLREDEGYYEYEYDSSELENDTLSESRRKRGIIEGFKNPPNKFIVAGRTADISHYPWIVHLEMYNRGRQVSSCGGSLINSKFVLTAAHCLQLEFGSLNDIRVVLAEYDTRSKPMDCVVYSNGQRKCVNNVVMNPEQVIMHPEGHDIAILRLRGIAPYSESIRPICLPPFNIDTPRNRDLELLVAGWGAVYEGSPVQPIKRSTTVNLVPLEECRVLSPVPSVMMCAIGRRGQDACYGDSGGPLMAYYNGNYLLVGIVSGKHVAYAQCGSQVPTSYVNVYLYLKWIQSVMTPY